MIVPPQTLNFNVARTSFLLNYIVIIDMVSIQITYNVHYWTHKRKYQGETSAFELPNDGVMTRGWFDAFREHGAPTWHGQNPTPVFYDLQILAFMALFIVPVLTYLIIFPGIRRLRIISTFIFLSSMFIGCAILVSIHYPMWHSGQVQIMTTHKAFTNKKLNATLGVKIGLKHMNITLTSKDHNQFSLFALMKENSHENIMSYNERVDFLHVHSMEKELENALYKGLPYPILKVIEYLSVDRAGFVWGRRYRHAGYYTFAILWLAFACWLLQMLLLCLLPHYFGKMMCVVGVCTILGDLIYFLNAPSNLCIRFSSPHNTTAVLTFKPSHSFHTTVFTGLFSMFVGFSIVLWERLTNNRFQTVFSARIDEMCGLR